MANEVKEVQFHDGEGLIYTDFNDAQRFLRAQLWDQVVASKFHTNLDEFRPDFMNAAANAACYSIGGGGAPYASGSNNLSLVEGMILQKVTTNENGSDPDFLAYYISPFEVSLATAVGDATNPRYDILCVRLQNESADVLDNIVRDFKDGTTGALTSQNFVKKRKVKATFQVVQGTPAASPSQPAVPANYVKVAAVLVPALHNTFHSHNNILDYRIPHGIATTVTYAFDNGNGVNIQNGWTVHTSGGLSASSALGVVRIFPQPPGFVNARLLLVSVCGDLNGANVQLIRRHHDIVLASATDAMVEDLSATGLTNGVNQLNGISPSVPVWANGYNAGIAGKIQAGPAGVGDPRMTTLGLKITANLVPNNTLRYVRWLWAVE